MTESSVAGAPVERASFAEDFLDIFYAPSAVFERRRAASPWIPLLVVTGLYAIATYVYSTLLSPIFAAQMARQVAQLPAEQQAAALAMQERFAVVGVLAGGLFTPVITVLVLGLVTWLLGKLLDSQQPLRAAFLVVTFSLMPRVLELILTALQAFVLDVSTMTNVFQASLSAARFVDTTTASPTVLGLLSRIDPFIIWSYLLIAIGVRVTGRIAMGKALILAAVLWLIGSVPSILGAAASLGPR